jgi:hypothetical protein
MKIMLGGESLSYDVQGRCEYGADEVLLERDDNLIAHAPWAGQGYTVQPFLGEALYVQICEGIQLLIRGFLRELGAEGLERFALERYHTSVSNAMHLQVVEKIREGFPIHLFPVPFDPVTQRISEICRIPLQVQNPMTGLEVFCLRIVRPCANDFNPPHRDVWLDRLRNAVNTYVPLAGSNEKSTLSLVPGSHLWKESEIERTAQGSQVNGVSYTVPAVTGAKRQIAMVRPDPAPNELLLFSPYLIHGGACNFNKDSTRVSLEIRFWRRQGL